MNRERLSKLAEWLEAGAPHKRVRFDMNVMGNFVDADGLCTTPSNPDCNTVCCIAGAACVFFGTTKDVENAYFGFDWKGVAAILLEMPIEKACKLFCPDVPEGKSRTYEKITPRHAAKVIRHLLATGNVDWSVARIGFITKG